MRLPLTLFLLLIFCLFTGKQLSQVSDLDSADLIPKQCEIGVIFEYQNDLPIPLKSMTETAWLGILTP